MYPSAQPSHWRSLAGYLAAIVGVVLTAGVIEVVRAHADLPNSYLLYLFAVIGSAVWFGRGPAVVAAILAFLAYNWFFVPPLHTLRAIDAGGWLALLIFLVTAVSVGHLTALLQSQATEARRHERDATALADASWAVASQLVLEGALREVLRRIAEIAPVRSAVVLGTEVDHPLATWTGNEAASASPDARARAGTTGDAVARAGSAERLELPLVIHGETVGQLRLELLPGANLPAHERRVVESLARHAALALERDRLIQVEAAGKALAQGDRLKTALLSMVSHDFRSPLASIKASAAAYLQDETAWTSSSLQELHQGIVREADRLNAIVGNLLTLSRLEADSWRPAFEETSLWEVVEMARTGFSLEQNDRIRSRLAPELPSAWADPVEIGQVLHNLLDNALKYSPPGSPVEISVEADEQTLAVQVRDYGPGLPAGDEDRVFERFYRAPAYRESSVPGAGIGLSVCQGLVDAHGGTLTASNCAGGGAVFRMVLPRREGTGTCSKSS